MRLRFLLTRRWILFAAAVVVLAWGTAWLGEWQFHRLQDRQQRNAWTERNLAATPAPVADVLALDEQLPADREYQRVQASGRYVPAESFVVRYRTRDGKGGVEVVTPLRLDDGSAVLVDRGWMGTDDPAFAPDDAPSPPAGTVEVEGWARADSTGDATDIVDGSTREISSRAAVDLVDGPLRRGYLALREQSPTAGDELAPAEKPDLGEGPHRFYGYQWWFFGVLAVGGFAYLAYDEARGGNGRRRRRPAPEDPDGPESPDSPAGPAEADAQNERRNPPSTGSATPVT